MGICGPLKGLFVYTISGQAGTVTCSTRTTTVTCIYGKTGNISYTAF